MGSEVVAMSYKVVAMGCDGLQDQKLWKLKKKTR